MKEEKLIIAYCKTEISGMTENHVKTAIVDGPHYRV
jgi:hypothetical protein